MRRNIPEQKQLDILIKDLKNTLGILKGTQQENPYFINQDTKRVFILIGDMVLFLEDRIEKLEREIDRIKL